MTRSRNVLWSCLPSHLGIRGAVEQMQQLPASNARTIIDLGISPPPHLAKPKGQTYIIVIVLCNPKPQERKGKTVSKGLRTVCQGTLSIVIVAPFEVPQYVTPCTRSEAQRSEIPPCGTASHLNQTKHATLISMKCGLPSCTNSAYSRTCSPGFQHRPQSLSYHMHLHRTPRRGENIPPQHSCLSRASGDTLCASSFPVVSAVSRQTSPRSLQTAAWMTFFFTSKPCQLVSTHSRPMPRLNLPPQIPTLRSQDTLNAHDAMQRRSAGHERGGRTCRRL